MKELLRYIGWGIVLVVAISFLIALPLVLVFTGYIILGVIISIIELGTFVGLIAYAVSHELDERW